ncbi:MAG: hypothetical protein KC620_22680, partial [Myxococcales bacterium]|nr:hypothetical protein [Myxococcales bacterium]
DAALAEAPDAWPVHQTRVRALATLGRADEARAALREAEAVAPDRCALLDDRAALEDDRTAGFDDRLVAAYTACERPLDAVERLLTLKRPEAALDRLDHDAGDDAERARKLRARALVALGQLDEARDALGDADDFESARLAIDLDAASGAVNEADTSAALTALVADHPTAHEALVFIGARPEWSPFAAFALDSEAAIAAYEATVPLPGPAVRVLDHSASLYFADGTSLRWVHEILAVRSREAAETYGELALPDQVQPLAVYTRKADGRRLFAEETPEKETLSLPDLDDGDYVVAIYLEPGDNGYLYDSGFLTPRAYFRGVDLPIFHQRLEVIGPDDTPPDHQRVHGAPPAEPIALDGRAGVRFEAHGVPLWPPEADSVPAGLWLPSARVGRRVSLRDDVDYYRDRVLARRRRTARFDAWARAAAGEGTVEKRVARLSRAVREAVDGAGGLVADDAALAVPSGEGNRALTLSAALEAAGIAHRLLLARPKVHVGAGPFLQVMDFPYPLIQLASGRFIDPGPDRAAPGFVPFPLLGGDALVVWPPDAPLGPVALPVERGVPDRRTVTLRAHWAEDGSLTGEVVDRLEGQEAIVIGRAFERLDPEDRPRLIERLLLGAVGAATVTALDDPTAQPPDGPLVLRYRFRATPGPTLRLGAFPVQPGRRYGRVGERTTPLAIDLPVDQRVHLTLTSDRPFAAKLRPGTLTEGAASFALTADVHDDEIEIETHLVVPGGAISTDVYAGFARWARDVDDAERVRLGARQETTR